MGGWSEAIPSEALGVGKWAQLRLLETADPSLVFINAGLGHVYWLNSFHGKLQRVKICIILFFCHLFIFILPRNNI